MIFSLLIYTCLLNGKECRPHVENIERMSLMQCVVTGQQAMAIYDRDHPKRKSVMYRCTDRPQKYIKANEA